MALWPLSLSWSPCLNKTRFTCWLAWVQATFGYWTQGRIRSCTQLKSWNAKSTKLWAQFLGLSSKENKIPKYTHGNSRKLLATLTTMHRTLITSLRDQSKHWLSMGIRLLLTTTSQLQSASWSPEIIRSGWLTLLKGLLSSLSHVTSLLVNCRQWISNMFHRISSSLQKHKIKATHLTKIIWLEVRDKTVWSRFGICMTWSTCSILWCQRSSALLWPCISLSPTWFVPFQMATWDSLI